MQLNDGLEELGAKEVINGSKYEGEVFAESAIETVKLPSALKRIEEKTFYGCEHLKSVKILSGTECIGKGCFENSHIEEITLSNTLEDIYFDALYICKHLKTVWVEKDCVIDIRSYVSDNVKIQCK